MSIVVRSETSLEEALERLMLDSGIADVELEGDDGVRLPGCKGLLSARSPVFERMFWGKFAESSSEVVKVGYPGEVLRKVVRYCYTDTIELSENDFQSSIKTEDHSLNTNNSQREAIHHLLTLADAANYFELSKLRQIVIEKANEFLRQHPTASFCYLEEAKCVGCSEVLEEALATINTHLPNLVTSSTDSIKQLSPPTLLEILQDEFSPCEERLLYQLLELWVEGDGKDDRHEIARSQLAPHIRLDLIPASILERQVAPGGLVEESAVFEAYKEQAKAAEKKLDLLDCRSARRWKGSKSVLFEYDLNKDTVDLLASERLSTGVWEWKLVVEGGSETMFLGVEGCKHDFWMGQNGVRWRDKYHQGTCPFGYKTKSVVTMRLDLANGGGMLSVSVDDSKVETLFTKMLSTDDSSFTPAVCIKKPGAVRFVGIRRLDDA
jgi:hypothetical protein